MPFQSPLLAFASDPPPVVAFTTHPDPARSLPHQNGLLAGAAEVDITPPPGMPKAGYSRTTGDGYGFRTRLRARVLHLRAGPGSVALVALDLLGGSAVLQHLVAKAIAEETDVQLAGLFLGATHTHAAPGQFCGSAMYNRYASNRPGFDPAWTQFLVERIAAAVITAVQTRRPARLAVGTTPVWGLTRNRSLPAHVRNAGVQFRDGAPHRKFAAVNPDLHLVRVDAAAADGGHEPLAALVVFSIHGTGISAASREYNADVWGYLTGALAHDIERATGTRAVVGAIEGTHADVAPALRPGRAGHLEAERIGRGIATEALALYQRLAADLERDASGQVRISYGLREVDVSTAAGRTYNGVSIAPPRLGAAQLAGAKENTTPVLHRIPPFRAGFPKPFGLAGPHGAKWVLGSERGHERILPEATFPSVLPVHVLEIGPAILVGLPFEITVEAGRRIAAAAGPPGGEQTVIVSSVANEYWGYCTTEEEYALQYYEGGHTLHGPNTQRFLAAHAARLVGEVSGRVEPVVDVAASRSFVTVARRYLPRPSTARVHGGDWYEPHFVDPTGDDAACWAAVWEGGAPGDLVWHETLVRVEERDPTGDWRPARHHSRPVDDGDWQVSVRMANTSVDRRRFRRGDGPVPYEARWHDPFVGAGRTFRFVLLAGGEPVRCSEPFG